MTCLSLEVDEVNQTIVANEFVDKCFVQSAVRPELMRYCKLLHLGIYRILFTCSSYDM